MIGGTTNFGDSAAAFLILLAFLVGDCFDGVFLIATLGTDICAKSILAVVGPFERDRIFVLIVGSNRGVLDYLVKKFLQFICSEAAVFR